MEEWIIIKREDIFIHSSIIKRINKELGYTEDAKEEEQNTKRKKSEDGKGCEGNEIW